MKLPPRFDAMNSERIRLLGKKYAAGLNSAEVARLDQVTAEVDEMMRPMYEADIERLKQMAAETKSALARVRAIKAEFDLP